MSEKTITIGHWGDETEHCDVYAGRNADGEGITTVPVGETGWLGAGERFRPSENPDPNHLLQNSHPDQSPRRGRHEGIDLYFRYLMTRIESDPAFRDALLSLEGNTLGCECRHVTETPSDPGTEFGAARCESDWCHCDAIDLAIRIESDRYDTPRSTAPYPECNSSVVTRDWVDSPHYSPLFDLPNGQWQFRCDCGEEFRHSPELALGQTRWQSSASEL